MTKGKDGRRSFLVNQKTLQDNALDEGRIDQALANWQSSFPKLRVVDPFFIEGERPNSSIPIHKVQRRGERLNIWTF